MIPISVLNRILSRCLRFQNTPSSDRRLLGSTTFRLDRVSFLYNTTCILLTQSRQHIPSAVLPILYQIIYFNAYFRVSWQNNLKYLLCKICTSFYQYNIRSLWMRQDLTLHHTELGRRSSVGTDRQRA